jgi:hypothetical protein
MVTRAVTSPSSRATVTTVPGGACRIPTAMACGGASPRASDRAASRAQSTARTWAIPREIIQSRARANKAITGRTTAASAVTYPAASRPLVLGTAFPFLGTCP